MRKRCETKVVPIELLLTTMYSVSDVRDDSIRGKRYGYRGLRDNIRVRRDIQKGGKGILMLGLARLVLLSQRFPPIRVPKTWPTSGMESIADIVVVVGSI
jgi:hypothetical protein